MCLLACLLACLFVCLFVCLCLCVFFRSCACGRCARYEGLRHALCEHKLMLRPGHAPRNRVFKKALRSSEQTVANPQCQCAGRCLSQFVSYVCVCVCTSHHRNGAPWSMKLVLSLHPNGPSPLLTGVEFLTNLRAFYMVQLRRIHAESVEMTTTPAQELALCSLAAGLAACSEPPLCSAGMLDDMKPQLHTIHSGWPVNSEWPMRKNW